MGVGVVDGDAVDAFVGSGDAAGSLVAGTVVSAGAWLAWDGGAEASTDTRGEGAGVGVTTGVMVAREVKGGS